ncbi:hypothetical protein EMCRGX_G026001 [Ephydatia muelleri]
MSEQRVQLYVYDLTKGLAAQLSPLFLGKQIEGVWHTGVVVYGTEYFFGGLGIEYTSPGTLPMLGSPDKKVDLGSTSIPEDVFMDYLYDISSQYFPETYHLLEHNCNHFSNEVAQFLTGNKIPSYISDLPKEVMATPFGAQLLGSMQMQGPSGGTSVSHRRT